MLVFHECAVRARLCNENVAVDRMEFARQTLIKDMDLPICQLSHQEREEKT